MNRATSNQTDPWRATVNVTQIPESGLHREIEAGPAVRAAMAKTAGLRDLVFARAAFDMSPRSDGRVHVAGSVKARVGQTCVVTLDPVESDIDEEVDLIFAPEEQISHADAEDPEGEGKLPESPEPIVNGVIDLGRLATDVLYLAIDPYPRKAGAVFKPRIAAADPQDHPFAPLKGLKQAPRKPKSSGKKGGS